MARRIPFIALRATTLLACMMVALVAHDARSQCAPAVYAPNETVAGNTYAGWSATWWQWNLSIPVPNNPTFDMTGVHCDIKQTFPVFFLAGSGTSAPTTRDCSVPSGEPLLFPIINAECSNVEPPPFFGSTDEERMECAAALIDGVQVSKLSVTVDGVPVPSLKNFRVASPPFDFTMPAQNNILGLSGVTSGRAASDGYWIILEPLSAGQHEIHFEARVVSGPAKGFSQDVTYHLTVK